MFLSIEQRFTTSYNLKQHKKRKKQCEPPQSSPSVMAWAQLYIYWIEKDKLKHYLRPWRFLRKKLACSVFFFLRHIHLPIEYSLRKPMINKQNMKITKMPAIAMPTYSLATSRQPLSNANTSAQCCGWSGQQDNGISGIQSTNDALPQQCNYYYR